MRRTLYSIIALALLAATLFTLPTVATAQGPELDPSTLGMRPSGGFLDGNRLEQYEAELGTGIKWYVGMAGRQSPADMKGSVWGQVRKKTAVLPTVADRMNLVMTVPLSFGKGSAKTEGGREDIRAKLLETASGRWDDDYRTIARSLIDGGYPDTVIRLGHEFTGGWYPWSAQGNPDAYIAAYRHVHDVLASVSPDFRFEWNSARNTFIEHGPAAYPGDAYVDVVGIDIYYEPWKGDSKDFTDDLWKRRYLKVLEAHRDFAIAHGKPVSYAEWANGDVDQPAFIEKMYEWFVSLPDSGGGRLLYHAYFNAGKATYNLDGYPQSKARYIDVFGGSSAGPAVSPSTLAKVDPSTGTPAPAAEPPDAPVEPVSVEPEPQPPVPTEAPVDTATQFTLFDQPVNHQATEYAEVDFSAPADWRDPANFVDGSTFLRLEIVDKPSDKPVQVLVCMWRKKWQEETCTSAGIFEGTGSHWIELRNPGRWWRKNKWKWNAPIEHVRLMVKDPDTGKLLNTRSCGTACYKGDDITDHTPIGFDAEVVLVAKGFDLVTPADWAGCPVAFADSCVDDGSVAEPTPTRPTPEPTPTPTPRPADPAPAADPTPAAPARPILTLANSYTTAVGESFAIDATIDGDSIRWWKVRGPGSIRWRERSTAQPTMVFRKAGTYVLGVRVRGDGEVVKARVKVVVEPASDGAAAPTSSPVATPPAISAPKRQAPTGTPSISVRGAKATEGDSLAFKIVLSHAVKHDVTVRVVTQAVTATEREDFYPIDTVLVIPAGALKTYIGVGTIADGKTEPVESVRLRIKKVDGAEINVRGAIGQIHGQ